MTVKTVSPTISGFEDFARCRRERFLALDGESEAILLVREICLSDEVGCCNGRDREVVNDRIWAKQGILHGGSSRLQCHPGPGQLLSVWLHGA